MSKTLNIIKHVIKESLGDCWRNALPGTRVILTGTSQGYRGMKTYDSSRGNIPTGSKGEIVRVTRENGVPWVVVSFDGWYESAFVHPEDLSREDGLEICAIGEDIDMGGDLDCSAGDECIIIPAEDNGVHVEVTRKDGTKKRFWHRSKDAAMLFIKAIGLELTAEGMLDAALTMMEEIDRNKIAMDVRRYNKATITVGGSQYDITGSVANGYTLWLLTPGPYGHKRSLIDNFPTLDDLVAYAQANDNLNEGVTRLNRTQELLTAEQRRSIPKLYAQDGKGYEAIAYVKFFQPWGSWTWYATEFDGDDTFFGLVQGFEEELGYFSASELASVTGPGGLQIERDIHFTPTPLSKLRQNR